MNSKAGHQAGNDFDDTTVYQNYEKCKNSLNFNNLIKQFFFIIIFLMINQS